MAKNKFARQFTCSRALASISKAQYRILKDDCPTMKQFL